MVSKAKTDPMEQIYKQLLRYRKNPAGFVTNVLSLKKEYLWPKMREIMNSVRDHQFTAVRASHFVSKTFTAGRVVPWFKTCFQPSTVITTAPSDNMVRNQLWREIHAAVAGAQVRLGGKMTALGWDVKPNPDVLASLPADQREQWEKNFAIGFSTSPDTATEHATKMQGWHNEWVLVILDEACGIMPQIWRTVMEGLINDDQCKVLAIGNATDPECEFAKACYSSDVDKNDNKATYISDEGWNVITIDARDNPNYVQKRRVIPGLASYEYVERIITKYGEDGDGTRIRIKGLFPRYKEGTYYGYKLASARKEKRISPTEFKWDSSFPVFTATDTGDWWTACIFFQLIRDRIRLIDCYYDNSGQGQPAWAKALDSKPYVYGKEHYTGWEHKYGKAGRFQTGMATKDLAAQLGYNIIPVREHDFDDGIEATRSIWELLDINELTCQTIIQAASGYGKKKNEALSTEDKPAYHKQPKDTWHKHVMDALRHLAVQYRYGEIGGRERGFTEPTTVGSRVAAPQQSSYTNNALTRGLAKTGR